jgi:hypothetical protein
MKRVKWLAAKWPVSMRTLASRMKSQLFSADSFDGFVIERIRDDYIEGHYVEKINYQETVIDPFGHETVFDRIGYRQIDFTLYADFPNIELREPDRSIREFVSKLLEICDFSVTIEPLSIDLLGWVSELEVAGNGHLLVNSLQVAGVEFEKGVFAKILLKGDDDVRPTLDRIASMKVFDLEKLQVKIPCQQKLLPVQLSSSAQAKIPDDLWEELRPVLRAGLGRIRRRS